MSTALCLPTPFAMTVSPRRAARLLADLALLLILGNVRSYAAAPDDPQVTQLRQRLEEVSSDWPKLARYRDDNAALKPAAPGEARVVFMGDSITDAWPRVGAFFPGKPYVDRGISGQTTEQMLVRFRPDVIALGPRVVVILAGTNDIAGNTGTYDPGFTRGNIASMAELARANGIRVVLASVTPAFDYPWRPGLEPVGKILALNAWLRDYAAKNGCTYLDYFPSMADARNGLKAEYSPDGVHPNAAGYAVMEPLAEQAIAQALGGR